MARRRKMDPERKAFINSLLEHYQPKDAQDIQDMLKDLLGETLQVKCYNKVVTEVANKI